MRRLRSERIEALTLAIIDALARSSEVRLRDRAAATHKVDARLRRTFQVDPELDRKVRSRIASLSRRVPEGSREWDVLYQRYLEELSRR